MGIAPTWRMTIGSRSPSNRVRPLRWIIQAHDTESAPSGRQHGLSRRAAGLI
ncbi:hypothetical protein [Planotetraspora kaengkrachanensis]|uniref:hypothetical protein n=1 Tax=Planotetraspora kaengkrachanensis TaxID=575193 RepID=UPI0019445F11|nr:hypothetical protein [Planotetraspora kaengkrachanensis]